MGYDRFLNILPANTWKYLPHTFSSVMSHGVWLPYKPMVMLSNIIATAVARGGGRIIVSLPPRHGKSWFISQWVPSWFLGNWPDQRVILSSYEANFAATWGRRVRNIIKNEGYRVGVQLSEDSTAANNWMTTLDGGMMTAGVGGPITGKGFNLGIIDDPHKNWQEAQSATIRKMIQEWFDSTFYTRAEPGATIIVLMTRWHEDDLVGYLLREKMQDGWFYVRMPAIAEDYKGFADPLGRQPGEALIPQRYNEKALARIKASMTPMMWNALFQQRPAPLEGTVFLRSNWKFYRIPPRCSFILQSWDTASKLTIKKNKTAYSVCHTFGVSDRGVVLLDRFRERLEFPQLLRQAKIEYMKWRPNIVLIEDRDSGQALIQSLEQAKDVILPVLPVYPDIDKVIRGQAVSPWQEAGRVYLPEVTEGCLWPNEIIETFATFPNCTFMDDIDAFSQGMAYIMTMSMSGEVRSSGARRVKALLNGYRSLM